MRFPQRLGTVLRRQGWILGLLVAACSASDADRPATGCTFLCLPDGGAIDARGDTATGMDAAGGTDAATSTRNPLCGPTTAKTEDMASLCDPDWTNACSTPIEPSDAADASTEGGSPAADSDASSSGSPDASDVSLSDDAAADALGEQADAAADVSAEVDAYASPPASNDAGATLDASSLTEAAPPSGGLACHVTKDANGVTSVCEPAGIARDGEPCSSSMDCAPGLGCVSGLSGGECRPFCCDDSEGCPYASFCATRVLFDATKAILVTPVPVCTPIVSCKLLAADGGTGSCPAGRACTIVRADGTTSCDTPGTGHSGDPCPCADGFVCSKGTHQCFPLCHTSASRTECPGGTCQSGSSSFPAGFGVCIGGDAG